MINVKAQPPMNRTYRFWISKHGSPIRLSLKVGQTITVTSGGATDEGWHWAEGADCDGRMSGGSEGYARLSELGATPRPGIYATPPTALAQRERDTRPVAYPRWQREGDWRRDHQAEAAGF